MDLGQKLPRASPLLPTYGFELLMWGPLNAAPPATRCPHRKTNTTLCMRKCKCHCLCLF